MVTGDSQEEVIIFRYKHTDKQTLIIIYISSLPSSSISASSQMGREEIKYELIKGERGLRGPPGMTVRGPPGEKFEKTVHLV